MMLTPVKATGASYETGPATALFLKKVSGLIRWHQFRRLFSYAIFGASLSKLLARLKSAEQASVQR